MGGDDLRRTCELSTLIREARATSFPVATSWPRMVSTSTSLTHNYHPSCIVTSFSFFFYEACIMAAEPDAKFAIHEAAREGKSKYIREVQIGVSR